MAILESDVTSDVSVQLRKVSQARTPFSTFVTNRNFHQTVKISNKKFDSVKKRVQKQVVTAALQQ